MNSESDENVTITDIAMQHWEWVEKQGWHNKTTLEYLALIASEVGEAVNEVRQERFSPNFQYELADIILRTLDLAIDSGIDIEAAIQQKMQLNFTQGKKPDRLK